MASPSVPTAEPDTPLQFINPVCWQLEWLLVSLVILWLGGLCLIINEALECNCPDRNEDIWKRNFHPSLRIADYWDNGSQGTIFPEVNRHDYRAHQWARTLLGRTIQTCCSPHNKRIFSNSQFFGSDEKCWHSEEGAVPSASCIHKANLTKYSFYPLQLRKPDLSGRVCLLFLNHVPKSTFHI